MSNEIRVGGLVLIAIGVLAFFIVRIENLGGIDPETSYQVRVRFENAAGLAVDDPVLLAGVGVGRVTSVGLTSDGFAEVAFQLSREIRLTEDAVGVVGSSGMLGEKVLEIRPGPGTGSPIDSGGYIRGGEPASIDQMVTVVADIARNLERTTESISRVLGTEAGEATLREILANVESFTQQIDTLLADNGDSLGTGFRRLEGTLTNLDSLSTELMDSLPSLVDEMRTLTADLRGVIDSNEGGVGAATDNLVDTATRLRRSATELEEVLSKMNRGEGSFARMVNEPETIDKLNQALESVDDSLAAADTFFRRVGQARFSFQLRTEFYDREDATKNYFGLRMNLGEQTDRAFLFHIVDDNIGGINESFITTERLRFDGTIIDRTVERQLVRREGFTFSAELAQRLGAFQIRGGILENQAGFGFDYYTLRDRLRLSAEAWDLGRDPDPHVKLRAQYQVVGRFFVTGGWDDLLRDQLRGFYIGGGYSFLTQ